MLSACDPGLSRFIVPSSHWEQVLDNSTNQQFGWEQAEFLHWRVAVLKEGSGHVAPVRAPVQPGAGHQHPLDGLHCRLSPDVSVRIIIGNYPMLGTPLVEKLLRDMG